MLVLDLDTSQGNAYSLLANAKILANNLDLDSDEITREMMTSDHHNLLRVFKKYFGDHVAILNDPTEK